jgi:hypothetical protein
MSNKRLYSVSSFRCVLVFPDVNYGPTQCFETFVRVLVALTVRLDLFSPEVGIVRRPGAVLRAPVPEAAVDEHDHTGATEHEISAATNPR